MFPETFRANLTLELRLTRRPQAPNKFTLLFLLILIKGAKDFTAQGAPTDGRRRLFQTSANPIPHPDTMSLKKSETANGLNNRFMTISLGRPTQRATPQIPEEEIGVKKSSTAERPVERRSGLIALQDSIESILNFKTHPNLVEERATGEGNLVSRVLHDQIKLKMLYGKGTPISKKFVIPTYEGVASSPDQTSRETIPRPPTEKDVIGSTEGKRTLMLSDDTSKILRRKTLLYSEPLYRPTGGIHTEKEEVRTDPRQLISILGDPVSYKRSHIANQEAPSFREENMQDSAQPWGSVNRKKNIKRAHRKERFMNTRGSTLRKESLDQDINDIDAFYNKDLNEQLTRRDPGEHNMLEHLLDDDRSPSFGTRDEKMERESTIKQIEQLTQQSSVLSKDYEFTDLPSEFANMEVSEGELPSYDQIGGDGINFRKSKVAKKKKKGHVHTKTVFSSEKRRVKTGPNSSSSQPRPPKSKRSLHYHHRHHHRWRRPYLHVRSPQLSPYYDYADEQDHQYYDDIPRLSSYMHFHRFPIAQRWPSPLLMAERFVPFPHLPKISEFSPQPLERLEHLPSPPPIPPAIIDREEAGNREAEPVDEFAPLPEPVPEPEPPPIPELPFIKEIPPIAEPQEPAPENLDPKKTFDTGESNGGVKKSSSR